MATRKRTAAKAVPPQHGERFFERELTGEEAPSLTTLRELYSVSLEFFALEPWRTLSDAELIAVKDPATGQVGYCCVMGALGEVFKLHVFLGTEGYRVFDAMQSQNPEVIDWMYGTAGGISVQMVQRSELKPQDRELLRVLGHPAKPAQLVPIFRAQRKGYFPWFVNEPEAKFLTACVRAFMAILAELPKGSGVEFTNPGKYLPLLIPKGESGEFAVDKIAPPNLTSPVIEMPVWDRDRLTKINGAKFPLEGIIEVDHFFTSASVGEKHERKACMALCLAVDAVSATVLKPGIGKPGESASTAMAEVLISAVESLKSIPKEVHVRDRHRKAALTPLAKELGCHLKAAASMPALDFAKEQLTAMLGS